MPHINQIGRYDALAMAALLLIITLMNWAAITGQTHYLQPMDTAESLYITDFRLLADNLRRGELGLWNPYTFGGFPLFASPHSGFFYPIHRLFLSIPWGDDPYPPIAYTAYVLTHLALQGVTLFVLLRVIGLRWQAALIGSLSFVLLPIMGNTGRGHQIAPMAWWPVIVALVVLAERSQGRRWLGYSALGGLAFGVMFTLPNPQSAFMLPILGILGLICLVKTQGHFAGLVKVAGIFSIVCGIGALVAAIALVPLFELLSVTRRWYTLDTALDGFAPLPFAKFGLMKFDLHQFAGFISVEKSNAVNATNFLGWFVASAIIIAFVLMLHRLVRSRMKSVTGSDGSTFLFGAIFPSLIILMSTAIMFDIGGRQVLYYVPGLNKIRELSEYMFVWAFGAAILVGYVSDQILRFLHEAINPRSRWIRVICIIIVGICFAVTVVELTVPNWTTAISVALPKGLASFAVVATAMYLIIPWNATRVLATVVLVGALMSSLSTTKLMQFDYANYDIRAHYLRNETFKRFVPVPGDPYRVFPTAKPDLPRYNWNLADYLGFYDIFGLTNMTIASSHDAYLHMLDMEDSGNISVANLLNIRYLIVSPASAERMVGNWPDKFRREADLPADVLSWEPPMTRAVSYAVLRNLSAPGQAWAVTHYESVHRSAPEHFNLLRLKPELLTTQASVEGPLSERDRALMEQARDGPTTISWHARTADRLELEVESDTPRMVVLSEVFYPGWEATVNNQPAPVYKIFGHVRGVVVMGGKTRIELKFRPFSLQVGAGLLAVGLALSILLLGAGFRAKKQPV